MPQHDGQPTTDAPIAERSPSKATPAQVEPPKPRKTVLCSRCEAPTSAPYYVTPETNQTSKQPICPGCYERDTCRATRERLDPN